MAGHLAERLAAPREAGTQRRSELLQATTHVLKGVLAGGGGLGVGGSSAQLLHGVPSGGAAGRGGRRRWAQGPWKRPQGRELPAQRALISRRCHEQQPEGGGWQAEWAREHAAGRGARSPQLDTKGLRLTTRRWRHRRRCPQPP